MQGVIKRRGEGYIVVSSGASFLVDGADVSQWNFQEGDTVEFSKEPGREAVVIGAIVPAHPEGTTKVRAEIG